MSTETVPSFRTMNSKGSTLTRLDIADFENIIAFNHINDDPGFQSTTRHLMSNSWCHDGVDRYQGTQIFDPFELNDDDSDMIIEYQAELDPDKNYFNQLAHYIC